MPVGYAIPRECCASGPTAPFLAVCRAYNLAEVLRRSGPCESQSLAKTRASVRPPRSQVGQRRPSTTSDTLSDSSMLPHRGENNDPHLDHARAHRWWSDDLLGCEEPRLPEILGRSILRQRGNAVLSLPCRCLGAALGHELCADASAQCRAFHTPLHLLSGHTLFWVHQKAKVGHSSSGREVDERRGQRLRGKCRCEMIETREGQSFGVWVQTLEGLALLRGHHAASGSKGA